MKKTHVKQTKVDLLIPVDPASIMPDEQTDCFGEEYDPRNADCSVCADEALCGLLYSSRIKKKIKETEKENGPYLDQTDFASVDWKKIEEKAKEYEDSGEPMTFQELTEAISVLARTKDQIAVAEFIKRSLPETRINIEGGNVYARR